MMMAGSIEGRTPFMDTMLASVVARFRDEFLIVGNGGKAVLRAAMDKVLPREIVRWKKIGFRVPIGEWLRRPYRDFVQEMLVSERSSLAGMISRPKLRALAGSTLPVDRITKKIIWSLTNLEMFLRTFKLTMKKIHWLACRPKQ